MIYAVTSTCITDKVMALRLNRQLLQHKIEHHVFVEDSQFDAFSECLWLAEKQDINLKRKPNRGLNGFGKQGTIVKWQCYQQMLNVVGDGDTIVNVDSDVIFVNESMIDDLNCSTLEAKGFRWPVPNKLARDSFFHLSGMIIATSGYVFKKAMSISLEDLSLLCDKMYSTVPEPNTHCTPSEDLITSYLYQVRGGAKVTDLGEKYTRAMEKSGYGSDKYDVVC